MKVTLFLAGLLTAGIVLLSGCELFDSGESETVQPAELSEYGGFTTSDEAPGFGDNDLLAAYSGGEDYEDNLEDDPRVRAAANRQGARHYALRIVWGNLDTRDSSVTAASSCPVTNWSGSLETDEGVIIVRRLIRFDRGDSIVRPRQDPRSVKWVSYTRDHVDGIQFRIVVPPHGSTDAVAGHLAITTPFYNGTIPLASLSDYREFVTYDECNKISIVATEAKPSDCPRGFMEGGWIAESDTSGRFRGAWIGGEGGLMGYLRGRYEIRDGHRVLYGKWITESGEFQGLLRGFWSPLRKDGGPDGIFEGHWVNAAFTVKGDFKGHYHIAEGDTSGFFHGRWRKDCL
jgi:hypothetical protein